MQASELKAILDQAEHLLWVLARCDVEDLAAPRAAILRRLRELENRARPFGVTDLYWSVLQQNLGLNRILL